MDEDDLPKKPRRWLEPVVLEPLSVADLREYIEALKGEIGRAEGAIAGKQGSRAEAEKFFRF